MLPRSLGIVLVATALAAAGQLLLKGGMAQIASALGSDASAAALLRHAPRNLLVISGAVTYVASAALYLVGLARLDVSVAFPIVGLSFAIVPLVAWLLLGESLPPLRWVGILVIAVGVAIVSKTASA